MTLIIELIDVRILDWRVDLVRACVDITYDLIDVEGNSWDKGTATFWNVIPQLYDPYGNPLPTPEEWFQLPPEYAATLLNITNDAKAALINRFL